jgi:hypothetical protein
VNFADVGSVGDGVDAELGEVGGGEDDGAGAEEDFGEDGWFAGGVMAQAVP